MNRTNEQWLFALRSTGSEQEAALSDLRTIILAGLPYALSKYLSPSNPHFESLAEEVSQDTVLRVLDRLDTFQGRSQFTTWVHKIAIRIALTELRRRKWHDISLDNLFDKGVSTSTMLLMSEKAAGPEKSTLQKDMIDLIENLISEELTDKQRQALIAVSVHGLPLEEVARRMNTNRNALYKLLHDARLRLKNRLLTEGLTPEDVLAAFE
jgi:RNA polymerase sigma-70 factor (ECF subfamily)